jgi:hypothetical protein
VGEKNFFHSNVNCSPKDMFEFAEPMFYDPVHSLGLEAGTDEVSFLLIVPFIAGSPIESSVEYALAYANGSSAKTELQLTDTVLTTIVVGHQVWGNVMITIMTI